jgi:GT2 family glycosyltransferase
MNKSSVPISIIIVSWNTKKLVSECLRSLEPAGRNCSLEIILVDNASKDGTVEMAQRDFPHVICVQNSANLGFAKANNIGMNIATGQYVCLINSDVTVPEGCLETMLEYMEQHRDIGMLGPKMRLPDGSVGQSCMRFPSLWNWFCNAIGLNSVVKGNAGALIKDFMMSDFRYDHTADVNVLTGWFWMVRREALDQVGVLDDQFFMYGEDLDWPKRFNKAGWRVVFFNEAEAVHHCGASSSKAPVRFYVEMYRANLQYFRKHHSLPAVACFWVTMWLHQLLRIIGYGLVYLFKSAHRDETQYKIKRSLVCLVWLMNRKPAGELL